MSTLNVNLPEHLHSQILELAAHEGVSPDQFVAETLAEKVEVIETLHHIQGARADCSEKPDCLAVLMIVPAPQFNTGPHDHLAPYNEG